MNYPLLCQADYDFCQATIKMFENPPKAGGASKHYGEWVEMFLRGDLTGGPTMLNNGFELLQMLRRHSAVALLPVEGGRGPRHWQ
jgi:hypothetical protein